MAAAKNSDGRNELVLNKPDRCCISRLNPISGVEICKKKESEITFNTGRGYSSSGQQIHAQVIEDTGETLRVRFSDTTRGIDGEIEVSELTVTNIMREYDAGQYKGV